MTQPNLYDIPVQRIDGTPTSLRAFEGKVLLVVNVASQCGLTPQYAGLEKLYEAYAARGLAVLGFPANEFGAQEPGSNDSIAKFCETKFGVTFPMFEKIVVKGPKQHPLYAALTAGTDIQWNFEKFLVDRHGAIVERFSPQTAPDAPAVTAAIERELARA
jgi:glutathione peroxidase